MLNMKAIIAMTEQGGMGYQGKLPSWTLPGDLLRFKRLTENRVIVMGSNTFFSLPESKRPLPKRTNIIITRCPENTKFDPYRACPHVHITTLARFRVDYKQIMNDIIVIGGPMLIHALYPQIYKMDVTIVKQIVPCDVFFERMDDLFQWTLEHYEEDDLCIRATFSRTVYF